ERIQSANRCRAATCPRRCGQCSPTRSRRSRGSGIYPKSSNPRCGSNPGGVSSTTSSSYSSTRSFTCCVIVVRSRNSWRGNSGRDAPALAQRAGVSAGLELLGFHVPHLEQSQIHGLDLAVIVWTHTDPRLHPGDEFRLRPDSHGLVRLEDRGEPASDRAIATSLGLRGIVRGEDPCRWLPRCLRPLDALPEDRRPLV